MNPPADPRTPGLVGTTGADDCAAPASQHPGSLTAGMARHRAAIFFGIGSAFVILGGLVAAVTGPLKLTHGSWLTAYLVLVCGVAQCAIGLAQERLAVHPVRPRTSWIQLICWNAGNAAVIAGTLTALPIVTDIGVVLVIPLILTMHAVRNSPQRLLSRSYSAVMSVLIVSIPIGLLLAHLRHG